MKYKISSIGNTNSLLLKTSIAFFSFACFLAFSFLINIPFAHAQISSDIIGLRIYDNPERLSPLAWYRGRGFTGSPTETTIDGFPAIKQGSSLYVLGAKQDTGDLIATYIYVISFNDLSSNQGIEVFNEFTSNFRFTTFSGQEKLKVQRDLKRISDLSTVNYLIEDYRNQTGRHPSLSSGSFVTGLSSSKWPSWQATLGNQLGSSLPVDPINSYMGVCVDETGSATVNSCLSNDDCSMETGEVCQSACSISLPDSDSNTCWQEVEQSYYCPDSSYVYHYRYEGEAKGFELGISLEMGSLAWQPLPAYLNPSLCNDNTFASNGVCGDGILNPNEECEMGQSKVACPSQDVTWHNPQYVECPVTGELLCQYPEDSFSAEECGYYCGDNSVQADYEVCDGNEFVDIDGNAVDRGDKAICQTNCLGFYCAQGSTLVDGKCQAGYCLVEDQSCIETNDDGTTNPPHTTAAYYTQCTLNSSGGFKWTNCLISECEDTYHIFNNECRQDSSLNIEITNIQDANDVSNSITIEPDQETATWTESSINLLFNISAAIDVSCVLDGSLNSISLAGQNSCLYTGLSAGSHALSVEATTEFGDTASDQLTYIIGGDPTISIIDPPDYSSGGPDLPLTYIINQSGKIYYYIDDQEVYYENKSDGTHTYVFYDLIPGDHIITVKIENINGQAEALVHYEATSNPIPAKPTGLTAFYDQSKKEMKLVWQDNSNNETHFVLEKSTGSTGTIMETIDVYGSCDCAGDIQASNQTNEYYLTNNETVVSTLVSTKVSTKGKSKDQSLNKSLLARIKDNILYPIYYILTTKPAWAVPLGCFTSNIACLDRCNISCEYPSDDCPDSADYYCSDLNDGGGDPGSCSASSAVCPSSYQAVSQVSEKCGDSSYVRKATCGKQVETGWTQVGDNTTIGEDETVYIDSDIELNKTYYYRIKAVNDAGDSAYSNTASDYTHSGQGTIFLSSDSHNGDIMAWANSYYATSKAGVPGCSSAVNAQDAANCICSQLANSSPDIMPGQYKAWLSANDGNSSQCALLSNPADDGQRYFTANDNFQGAEEIDLIKTNNELVATTWQGLKKATINSQINYTESNSLVVASSPGSKAWTGTNTDGQCHSGSCTGDNCGSYACDKWNNIKNKTNAWPGVGLAYKSDASWVYQYQGEQCQNEARLYCVYYSANIPATYAPYCGDNICNGAESCDSCSQDCGECAVVVVDPPPATDGDWEQIGPGAGGWFRSVRFHPNNSSLVLLSGDQSGIHKSYDGGKTWRISANGLYNFAVEDIAVSGNTAIIATMGGVYKSDNFGDNWNYVWEDVAGPLKRETQQEPLGWISAVHISKANPNLMFAGLGKHHPVWSKSDTFGIYRSNDGGNTWVKSEGGLSDSDKGSSSKREPILHFSSDPKNENIVYMGTRKAFFKSTDAGKTWKKIRDEGSWYSVVDPKDSNIVYTLDFDSSYGEGHGQNVYKSTDGGSTWAHSSNGIASDANAEEIHFDPKNSNNLYIGIRSKSSNQIYKSTNGGISWTSVGTTNSNSDEGHFDGRGVATSFDVFNGHLIKAPNMYLSEDDGQTWKNVYATNLGNDYWKGTGAELFCVEDIALDKKISGKMFMAVWDSGLWESSDYGESWKPHSEIKDTYTLVKKDDNGNPYKTYSGRTVVVDPSDSNTIYVGMAANKQASDGSIPGMLTISRDGGNTWNEVPNLPERIPLNLLALDNGNIFVFFQWFGLYKSTNKGNSWEYVSGGLDNNSAGVVSVDPRNENTLYYGVIWEGLWKSTNGGSPGSWVKKSSNSITYPRDVTVAPDGTVWVVQGGNNYGVWKSTDGAETFEKVFALDVDSEGFTANDLILYEEILVDSEDSNTVYVAAKDNYRPLVWNGVGVYVTHDAGETWNFLADGMYHKNVVSMNIDKDAGFLYAGVNCHSMFRYSLNNSNSGNTNPPN